MVTLVNRAKMSITSTGTGTPITLGSAEDGYQSFADAGVSNGDIVRYVIEDGDNWEIGSGTYTASGTTLTRSVTESSNSDNRINLTADAIIFITAEADDIQQPPSEGAFADGDKTKLDGIETNADVTDTANVTAAGALMDSEVTNLAQVKAFDSSDYATAAQGTTADNALPKAGGTMTGALSMSGNAINDTKLGYHDLGATQGASPYPYRYYRITSDLTFDDNRGYEVFIDGDDNHGYASLSHIWISSHNSSGNLDRVRMTYVSGEKRMLEVILASDEHVWIRSTKQWGRIRIRALYANEDVSAMPFATLEAEPSNAQFTEIEDFEWSGDDNTKTVEKNWHSNNDGSGSGLDADTLDGQHASAFLTEHPNISAASSSNNSGRTYIQDITVDDNGHVTGIATATETVTDTNTNQLTTFQLEDGDGTEVTISHGKEVKFVEGGGIDINWTDTSTGSDGDPYDLTFTVSESGHYHNRNRIYDNRAAGDVLPDDLPDKMVYFTFTDDLPNTGNTWDSVINMKGWSDGYRAWQLASNSGNGDGNTGLYFRSGEDSSWGTMQRVFADDYHPNADKWTTARTLSLTGEASGSVSWDGSANASLNVTLSNTALDDQYVDVTGDTMSGPLKLEGGSYSSGIDTETNAALVIESGQEIFGDNGNYLRTLLKWTTDSDIEIGQNGTALISGINLKPGASGNAKVNGQRLFAEDYHPNADKWTTARTVSLTGDVTGSASIDGSANASISTTITDTALDDRYQKISDKEFFSITNSGTTAGTWLGSHDDITAYFDGMTIAFYQNGIAGASTTTLNINSLGAKTIYYANDSKLTTHYGSRALIMLQYDADQDRFYAHDFYYSDYNSYQRFTTDITVNNSASSGVAVHGYQLLLEGYDGKFYPVTEGGSTGNTNAVSTANLKLGGLMLQYEYSTDYNANATLTRNELYVFRESSSMEYWNNLDSGWATADRPVYLVGTVQTDGSWKLDNTSYTSFLTQTLPTSDDGKIYVQIGMMGDNYDNYHLYDIHPIFIYKDGGIKTYSGYAEYAAEAAKWATSRTLSLSGDASGSVSWDGSANATLSVTVANDSHTHNTWNLPAYDASINIDTEHFDNFYGTTKSTETDDGTWPSNYYFGASLGGSKSRGLQLSSPYSSANALWYRAGTDNPSSENGANNWKNWRQLYDTSYHPEADKWTTARTLSLTGEVTGSVSWDGSANASISTTLTESPNFSTSLTVDGHTLQDSADRSGLLEISTSLGTWRGIQIKPTSTSLWSIMGDQDDFGLYDDYNAEWIMRYNENSTLQLYGNGSNQLSVGSTYVEVAGQIRHIGDSDTYMEFDAADSWRVVAGGGEKLSTQSNGITITSATGYADFGSSNSSWFHMSTDRPNFYMAQGLRVNGTLGVYNQNTYLTSDDLYLNGQILHYGDTDTYMEYHAADQWRVVTGGTERLEVNNTNTTVANNLVVSGNLTVSGTTPAASANDDIFWENGTNVSSNYTITNGKNAMSAGPITIDSGVTVTVGDGETWTVV